MNLLEFHLLHSHAVFNGNRDDLGRPKSCVFGGVKRARISSQCHKRAIRLHLRDNSKWRQHFQAVRTRKVVDELAKHLSLARDPNAQQADQTELQLAQAAGQVIAGLKFEGDVRRVTTTMLFSASQYQALAKSLHTLADAEKEKTCKAITALIELGLKENKSDADKEKIKNLNSQLEKALKKTLTEALGGSAESLLGSEAADIALFCRMVASHSNLTVEAAAMFSHAISTHHAEPEPDFYTAVDDRAKEQDETGADMMGQIEFVSATYYRYIAVNLDLLFYQKGNGRPSANLACFAGENDRKTRQDIIRAFTEAALRAVPSGRQTTMNSHTSVAYALGVVRKGQPLQLVNAFEKPVEGQKAAGLLGPSILKLEDFRKKMFDAWEIKDAEMACFCPVPPDGFTAPMPLPESKFIDALVSHVH